MRKRHAGLRPLAPTVIHVQHVFDPLSASELLLGEVARAGAKQPAEHGG